MHQMNLIHSLTSRIAVLSVLLFSTANGGEVCTYDYNIVQRSGKIDYSYDGEPIKILSQTPSVVRFTVGNTWTFSGSVMDRVFVEYPAEAGGDRECFSENSVSSGSSIGRSLYAYCSQAGIAMVRIYVEDSSFVDVKETVSIPHTCFGQGSSEARKNHGLEYLVVLSCLPTCTGYVDPTGYFNITTNTDSPSEVPSFHPSELPSSVPSTAPTEEPSNAPSFAPTDYPSEAHSYLPSLEHSVAPSSEPTPVPSRAPTKEPTAQPTSNPTKKPTAQPTPIPTRRPTPHPAPTKARNGSRCARDAYCASGRCSKGFTCQNKIPNGQWCGAHNDCVSNRCKTTWKGFRCK